MTLGGFLSGPDPRNEAWYPEYEDSDIEEDVFNASEKYPEWAGSAPVNLKPGIRIAKGKQVSSLPASIISLEDEDDHVNLLVYGKSGAGKTVFAGSAANVLFIAPEDDGTLSAKRAGSKAKKWPVKHWRDLQTAYEWLYDNPDHGFDWIVIDSATEMQQMLLRYILENAVAENSQRDPDIPAIQDHQKWQNMFKRFVKAFNALPVNVLWTALVRNETNEEGEEFLIPDIQGKGYQLAQSFASYMTSYGYLSVITKNVKVRPKKDGDEPEIKKIKVRRITWEDTGPVTGKDRTRRLAPHTDGKTLEQIEHMIFDGGPVTKKTNTEEDE